MEMNIILIITIGGYLTGVVWSMYPRRSNADPWMLDADTRMADTYYGMSHGDSGMSPANPGVSPAKPWMSHADTGMSPANPGVSPAMPWMLHADTGMSPANPGVSPAMPWMLDENPGLSLSNPLMLDGNPGMPDSYPGMADTYHGMSPADPRKSPAMPWMSDGNPGVSPSNPWMLDGNPRMPDTYPKMSLADPKMSHDDTGVSPAYPGMPHADTEVSPAYHEMSHADTGVSPAYPGMPHADTGMSPAYHGMSHADTGVSPAYHGMSHADTEVSPAYHEMSDLELRMSAMALAAAMPEQKNGYIFTKKNTEFPHVVSIHRSERTFAVLKRLTCNLEMRFTCTANLLSLKILISAAHCFAKWDQYFYSVQAGSIEKGTHPNKDNGKWLTIKAVFIHSEYNGNNNVDICIAKTHKHFETSPSVNPINLCTQNVVLSNGFTVVGWGTVEREITSDNLGMKLDNQLYSHVNIVDKSNCESYQHYCQVFGICNDERFVLGLRANGKSLGAGFSGSALKPKGINCIYALTIEAQKCNDENPALFIKVGPFSKWIRKAVRLITDSRFQGKYYFAEDGMEPVIIN